LRTAGYGIPGKKTPNLDAVLRNIALPNETGLMSEVAERR
jgi:hypothetical protein